MVRGRSGSLLSFLVCGACGRYGFDPSTAAGDALDDVQLMYSRLYWFSGSGASCNITTNRLYCLEI